MSWLEQREGWLPKATPDPPKKRKSKGEVLRLADAAELLAVDRKTLLKYLGRGDGAILRKGKDWFRLPSGYIRIYRASIESLRNQI
jgi:hypothetical protein